MLKIIFK